MSTTLDLTKYEPDSEQIVRYSCGFCDYTHTDYDTVVEHIRDLETGKHRNRNPFQEPIRIQGLNHHGNVVDDINAIEAYGMKTEENPHDGTESTTVLPSSVPKHTRQAEIIELAKTKPGLSAKDIALQILDESEYQKKADYVVCVLRRHLSRKEFDKRVDGLTTDDIPEGIITKFQRLSSTRQRIIEARLRCPPGSGAENKTVAESADASEGYTTSVLSRYSALFDDLMTLVRDDGLVGPGFLIPLHGDDDRDDIDVPSLEMESVTLPSLPEPETTDAESDSDHSAPQATADGGTTTVTANESQTVGTVSPGGDDQEFVTVSVADLELLQSRMEAVLKTAESNEAIAPENSTMQSVAKARFQDMQMVESFLNTVEWGDE